MKFICFDLESGGPSIEYSVLSASFSVIEHNIEDLSFKLIDELDFMIKHDVYKVHPGGMAVNKLDLNEVDAKGVSLSQAGSLLITFIKKHGSKSGDLLIPLGHGIKGDIDQIHHQKILSPNNWSNYVSHKTLDTGGLALAYQTMGLLPVDLSLKLSELCSFFKLSGYEFHTARGDKLATIDLAYSLLKLKK